MPLMNLVGGGAPKATVTGTTGSPNIDSSTRAGKTIYRFTGSGSITVGVGGTCEVLVIGGGGAGNNNGFSNAGGTSNGGGGGEIINAQAPPVTIPATAGQATGVGDVVFAGSPGGIAFYGAAAAYRGGSGIGGSSHVGSGGANRVTANNGVAANLYGGGGGGASNPENNATTRTGGAGANGIVIVDCYV
jgi:hypothetical protein